jgi:hypothetical protein
MVAIQGSSTRLIGIPNNVDIACRATPLGQFGREKNTKSSYDVGCSTQRSGLRELFHPGVDGPTGPLAGLNRDPGGGFADFEP